MAKKPDLTVEEIDQLALEDASRNDFIAFSCYTNKDYDAQWFHEEIAQALEDVLAGKIRRLMIELPPRHGKSEEVTINFPAYALGKRPELGIMTASYSDTLAEQFGGRCRDLMQTPEYRKLFPETTLKQDSKAKSLWRTSKKGQYLSGGVGSAFTGFGADILILDDPFKNREEADSETYRNSKWSWYRSSYLTRQAPGAAIIVINTRWHKDDISGRLLEAEAEGADKWHRIRYPAIATEDEKHRKAGEALWPSRFPIEELHSLEKSLGVYEFSALYQQEPILAENQEFKEEYITYFDEGALQGKYLDYYTGVDLAISKKDSADDTVVTTIAKEPSKPWIYIVEQTGGHLDPGQGCAALFMHVEKYRPLKVGIDSNAYQSSFAFWVKEEQMRRGTYFDITELTTQNNKEQRIRGLIPMYKSHVIKHRLSQRKLKDQLMAFPQGKHDDYPDSVEMAVSLVENTARRVGRTQSTSNDIYSAI